MDEKVKLIIGIVLLAIAILVYLFSQLSTSLESVGTNLMLIFIATILALAGVLLILRSVQKLA
ncbi:hypothetical protein [Methanobacterium alcaliphilum]|uniref:hypothetical protein n=1 Tax=Methanobacterium alcaliphilum TaxID=392018 RepID=UPI00200A6DD9|nr:hypothetical protein [Methanobacterium alcaliphilum]MCK9150535.1 hypothetical protein [Methanobacterium alcaliphilum]